MALPPYPTDGENEADGLTWHFLNSIDPHHTYSLGLMAVPNTYDPTRDI